MKPKKLTHAQAGRLGGLKGGLAKSIAKISAARINGALGGRPRKNIP